MIQIHSLHNSSLRSKHLWIAYAVIKCVFDMALEMQLQLVLGARSFDHQRFVDSNTVRHTYRSAHAAAAAHVWLGREAFALRIHAGLWFVNEQPGTYILLRIKLRRSVKPARRSSRCAKRMSAHAHNVHGKSSNSDRWTWCINWTWWGKRNMYGFVVFLRGVGDEV
jgi:hypothetical protein